MVQVGGLVAEPQITQVSVFVEHQLDQLASVIERHLSADVMAIYGPIYPGAETRVREVIEARRGKRKSKLAVVLDTAGGIIEVVERMVNVIRHHYSEVVMIVPNKAMSAGTVLALSGDAIMMDYFSCLGPVDPQIEVERGNLVPATSYLIQYERLKEKSKEGSTEGLTGAEIVLLQKLDLAELHSFEEAKKLSDTLLQEWLVKYKFKEWKTTERTGKEVTDEMRKARALEIATTLATCERWHSHGRPLSRDVLQNQLNLKIDDFGADTALSKAIGAYHDFLTDYMGKIAAYHFIHTKGTCLFLTWSQR